MHFNVVQNSKLSFSKDKMARLGSKGISIYYTLDELAAYVEGQRNKDWPVFP
jgi:hypothetical protein